MNKSVVYYIGNRFITKEVEMLGENIRIGFEENEYSLLSQYACKSRESQGR